MSSHVNPNSGAIVIGGGIGGLSAGIGLVRAGVRVRLFERAAEFGEVGAGLQIAPNCTRILADLGLLHEVLALGVRPQSMVMKDAVDGSALTRLDLGDLEARYGFPYVVIHRSDLHSVLLREACRLGVELVNNAAAVAYSTAADHAEVTFADGSVHRADVVIAADGLHSVARSLLVDDEPVSSAYVAYRGAVPIEAVRDDDVSETDVVVHVGPGCHFVQYPLRGGAMFNQVAVFESPKALAGQQDWGTPDELDAAFEGTSEPVQAGLRHMWRDRWWRMYDRDPISTWVHGRIALLGDAAHPPLQYMAQGAVMAIEDGWVLSQHVARLTDRIGRVDWEGALTAYEAVRPEHCRRVVTTARDWGKLWHLDGEERLQRNAVLTAREVDDYAWIDWIYGPTALFPQDEPEPYPQMSLAQAAAQVSAPA
ncbi:FAD-dependent monooxygenase [Knoellia sp. CPCC 206450]|uniref:FAD-dependent monooxygenase n=1 Tax=Knoellia tibetensis TaxID=3404798 RepID=UPI003B429AB4